MKKGRWVLLKVGSIVTAIDIVKIHTSIIKSNMSAGNMIKNETSQEEKTSSVQTL